MKHARPPRSPVERAVTARPLGREVDTHVNFPAFGRNGANPCSPPLSSLSLHVADAHAVLLLQLIKGYVPLVQQGKSWRKRKVIHSHIVQVRAPVLYRNDGTPVKYLPVGKEGSFEERRVAVRKVESTADMKLGLDLSGANGYAGMKGYSADAQTCLFNNVPHKHQNLIACLMFIAKGTRVRDHLVEAWKDTPPSRLGKMGELVLLLNDPEMKHAVRKPEVEPVPQAQVPQPAGRASKFSKSAQDARAAAKRKTQQKPEESTRPMRWKDQWLRDVPKSQKLPSPAEWEKEGIGDFDSQLDGLKPGALDEQCDYDRVIFWPYMPPFGERECEQAIDGDPAVVREYMIACILHENFRHPATMVNTWVEKPIRDTCKANRGQSIIDREFNEPMLSDLNMNHQIKQDDKGLLHEATFNGGKMEVLQADVLKMRDVTDFKALVRAKKFPSLYFQYLFNTYEGLGLPQRSIDSLAVMAECFVLYFLGMEHAVKLREVTALDHDMFEYYSKKSLVVFVKAGGKFAAYGWLLWSVFPSLFRLMGGLKYIDQTEQEGWNKINGQDVPHMELWLGAW